MEIKAGNRDKLAESMEALQGCFSDDVKLEDILATNSIITFFGFCEVLGYFYYRWDGYKAESQEGYRLQSPAEYVAHRVGNCWDMTELQRVWFEAHGYEVKTFLLYYYLSDENCPSHSILAYKNRGRWIWFEPMFHGARVEYAGLHEFNSIGELLQDFRRVFEENGKLSGVLPQNIDDGNWHLYEYLKPGYGISDGEFFEHCWRGKSMEL